MLRYEALKVCDNFVAPRHHAVDFHFVEMPTRLELDLGTIKPAQLQEVLVRVVSGAKPAARKKSRKKTVKLRMIKATKKPATKRTKKSPTKRKK